MGRWRIHCPIAPLPHCLILLVAGLGLVLPACTSGPPPPDKRPYEQQITAWRQSKDAAFQVHEPRQLFADSGGATSDFPRSGLFPDRIRRTRCRRI